MDIDAASLAASLEYARIRERLLALEAFYPCSPPRKRSLSDGKEQEAPPSSTVAEESPAVSPLPQPMPFEDCGSAHGMATTTSPAADAATPVAAAMTPAAASRTVVDNILGDVAASAGISAACASRTPLPLQLPSAQHSIPLELSTHKANATAAHAVLSPVAAKSPASTPAADSPQHNSLPAAEMQGDRSDGGSPSEAHEPHTATRCRRGLQLQRWPSSATDDPALLLPATAFACACLPSGHVAVLRQSGVDVWEACAESSKAATRPAPSASATAGGGGGGGGWRHVHTLAGPAGSRFDLLVTTPASVRLPSSAQPMLVACGYLEGAGVTALRADGSAPPLSGSVEAATEAARHHHIACVFRLDGAAAAMRMPSSLLVPTVLAAAPPLPRSPALKVPMASAPTCGVLLQTLPLEGTDEPEGEAMQLALGTADGACNPLQSHRRDGVWISPRSCDQRAEIRPSSPGCWTGVAQAACGCGG